MEGLRPQKTVVIVVSMPPLWAFLEDRVKKYPEMEIQSSMI